MLGTGAKENQIEKGTPVLVEYELVTLWKLSCAPDSSLFTSKEMKYSLRMFQEIIF